MNTLAVGFAHFPDLQDCQKHPQEMMTTPFKLMGTYCESQVYKKLRQG
jgi:hypothetical protein